MLQLRLLDQYVAYKQNVFDYLRAGCVQSNTHAHSPLDVAAFQLLVNQEIGPLYTVYKVCGFPSLLAGAMTGNIYNGNGKDDFFPVG